MTGFLKLFCDISVYYALIMYLSRLLMSVEYFAPGYLCLILMALGLSLRQSFCEEKPGADYILFAVPALSLLFHPNLFQCLLILPVWAWCVYSSLKQLFDFTYYDFQRLCRNELIILFLVYLCMFYLPAFKDAFTGIIPYFALLLAGMICMLRYLREDKTGGPVSIGLITTVLSVSFLAAFTNVFGFAGRFAKAVYLWIISLMFSVVTPETFSFMDEFKPPQAGDLEVGGIPMESEGIQDIALPAVIKEMSVFEKALIILAVVIIILVISWLLFKAVKGRRLYKREAEKEISEKIAVKRRARIPLFAPGDPREAVRYYYAKYVREALRKGLITSPSATSKDIMENTSDLLSEEDNARFRELYIKARYSSAAISHNEAQEARSCWKAFRSAEQASVRK